MRADLTMRANINKDSADQVHLVYEMEPGDETLCWLHEGIAHECSHVYHRRPKDPIRPLKTRCGIQVTLHVDKKYDDLFNIVRVQVTCLACLGDRPWPSSTV